MPQRITSSLHVWFSFHQLVAGFLLRPADALPGGALASCLIDMVGVGDIFVTQARKLAACATHDGSRCKALEKMAVLGSEGKYSGNVERDFHRAFLQPMLDRVGYLEPWSIPAPVRNERGHGLTEELISVLAPHEVFACIHGHGEDTFANMLLGRPAEYLKEFWSGLLRAEVLGHWRIRQHKIQHN